MKGFDIVALATSAGGLKALTVVLASLPRGFPATLVVVQHLDRRRPSLSDHHLLVNRGGFLSLTQTELVHFVRPSADPLFESTAAAFRDRAIAVVLSGSGVADFVLPLEEIAPMLQKLAGQSAVA